MRVTVAKQSLTELMRWSRIALFACAGGMLGYCAFVLVDTRVFQDRESRNLERRLEAQRAAARDSPPAKLLSAVGRLTSHAGEKKILLTITHEAATQIKALVINVRHGLQLIRDTTPQLTKPQRWFALARYIVEQILAYAPKPNRGLTALGTG